MPGAQQAVPAIADSPSGSRVIFHTKKPVPLICPKCKKNITTEVRKVPLTCCSCMAGADDFEYHHCCPECKSSLGMHHPKFDAHTYEVAVHGTPQD